MCRPAFRFRPPSPCNALYSPPPTPPGSVNSSLMAQNKETLQSFVEAVRRYMREHEILLGGESVLLAVSGGIDSMVMLDILARLAPIFRLNLGVVHFNHGLRETGEADADFVREEARRRGLKAFVGAADVRKIADDEGRSIEETARRERYGFIERIARRHRYDVVMTGHTADDNAETLLLNLLRGSGVTGLAGIPPTRRLAGSIILARPFLFAVRRDIATYAEAVGMEWREDESNSSDEFTRNRVRHTLLPALRAFNPSVVATLNSTAAVMRDVDRYLSGVVETAVRSALRGEPKPAERVALDVGHLRHLQPAIRGEVIQRVMSQTFDLPPLSHTAVERTIELLWKDTGARASLGGRYEALRDREEIVLLRHPPIIREIDKTFLPGEEIEVGESVLITTLLPDGEKPQFSSNPKVEYVDAATLPDKLVVRTWREGDRFHPIGMKGEKKVSDFLVDRKVPLDRKRQVMVVTDGEAIIWVCGMRLDERFRIGKEARKILKLELRPL